MTDEAPPDTRLDSNAVGPIVRSPDMKKMRDRRESLQGWKLAVFEWIYVPADVPTEYAGPLDELIGELATSDLETARNTLDEAQARFDEAASRIESAESRATTLQGNAAIAASLVVAGASLLLDSEKIESLGWRLMLGAALVAFVLCLVASAWRALSVTGRLFEFEQPGTERIRDRAKLSPEDALTARAAELLRAGSVASEIGAVKVGLLREAAGYFRLALGILALFVVLVAADVALGNGQAGTAPKQRHERDRSSSDAVRPTTPRPTTSETPTPRPTAAPPAKP